MGKPGELYRPSNGTEGEGFERAFCDECERDRGFRESGFEDGEAGCPIRARAGAWQKGDPEYPREWTYDEGGHPVCTAFEPELSDEERERREIEALMRDREQAGQGRLFE